MSEPVKDHAEYAFTDCTVSHAEDGQVTITGIGDAGDFAAYLNAPCRELGMARTCAVTVSIRPSPPGE